MRSTLLQSRLYSLNDRNMISEVPYFSQETILGTTEKMISEVPYFSQDCNLHDRHMISETQYFSQDNIL